MIEALSKVKTFVDTGVFKAVQAAGAAALESYDEWVPGNVALFERRRDVAVESLREAGFDQYEVANFSRNGKRCRHNWNVWRMNEWIGLGPSAASQRGGERWANPASLDRWSEALNEGRLDREEIVARFSPRLELLADWTPRSYPNRTGLEHMFFWQRTR